MKRKLALVFLFIVLGAIGYLSFSIYDELQQKQAVKKRIAELPKFSAVNLEGETVRSHTLTGHAPLILTYFNTGLQDEKGLYKFLVTHFDTTLTELRQELL